MFYPSSAYLCASPDYLSASLDYLGIALAYLAAELVYLVKMYIHAWNEERKTVKSPIPPQKKKKNSAQLQEKGQEWKVMDNKA